MISSMFFYLCCYHPYRHLRTYSFPTQLSSNLLSDHPPRWISPYRTSPASQLQSRARRLRSSIELLHMLSNHITSFEREDLRKAAVTVLRPRSMKAIQRIDDNARETLFTFS